MGTGEVSQARHQFESRKEDKTWTPGPALAKAVVDLGSVVSEIAAQLEVTATQPTVSPHRPAEGGVKATAQWTMGSARALRAVFGVPPDTPLILETAVEPQRTQEDAKNKTFAVPEPFTRLVKSWNLSNSQFCVTLSILRPFQSPISGSRVANYADPTVCAKRESQSAVAETVTANPRDAGVTLQRIGWITGRRAQPQREAQELPGLLVDGFLNPHAPLRNGDRFRL